MNKFGVLTLSNGSDGVKIGLEIHCQLTALNTKIGYYKAAEIANTAHENGTTLKEEAIKSGLINEKDYEKIVDPKKMIKPN